MLVSTHTRNTHDTRLISADLLDSFRAWRDIHKYVPSMNKLQSCRALKSLSPHFLLPSHFVQVCAEKGFKVQGADVVIPAGNTFSQVCKITATNQRSTLNISATSFVPWMHLVHMTNNHAHVHAHYLLSHHTCTGEFNHASSKDVSNPGDQVTFESHIAPIVMGSTGF